MRAAAVALVLIVGAAVVLWFANTLNSWVLGGLIGGLAALLLSIPISLTLFTFLSRRHDERLRAEMQEEFSQTQVYEDDYQLLPEQSYEVDASAYQQEEYAEEVRRPRPTPRRLPAGSEYPRLPAAGQAASPSGSLAFHQRSTIYPPVSGQQGRNAPAARERDKSAQRLGGPGRRGAAAGQGEGRPSQSLRSQHLTAALREARLEAARQNDDIEVSPTPRRQPGGRTSSSLGEQPQRTSLQKPQPQRQAPPPPVNRPRQRRVVDGQSRQADYRRPLPGRGESSASQYPPADHSRFVEPETDQLRNRNQQATGPVRRQPQTGPVARDPERPSGNLKNPLVRRAPYMYEDDPLREELTQQIDGPIVRRSSLYSAYNEDEEV